jgi:hypothetical protein
MSCTEDAEESEEKERLSAGDQKRMTRLLHEEFAMACANRGAGKRGKASERKGEW